MTVEQKCPDYPLKIVSNHEDKHEVDMLNQTILYDKISVHTILYDKTSVRSFMDFFL